MGRCWFGLLPPFSSLMPMLMIFFLFTLYRGPQFCFIRPGCWIDYRKSAKSTDIKQVTEVKPPIHRPSPKGHENPCSSEIPSNTCVDKLEIKNLFMSDRNCGEEVKVWLENVPSPSTTSYRLKYTQTLFLQNGISISVHFRRTRVDLLRSGSFDPCQELARASSMWLCVCVGKVLNGVSVELGGNFPIQLRSVNHPSPNRYQSNGAPNQAPFVLLWVAIIIGHRPTRMRNFVISEGTLEYLPRKQS